MATITFAGLTRTGCIVPPAACRFARYFAASQNPEMKASLYEKVVYSLVLATSAHRQPAARS